MFGIYKVHMTLLSELILTKIKITVFKTFKVYLFIEDSNAPLTVICTCIGWILPSKMKQLLPGVFYI